MTNRLYRQRSTVLDAAPVVLLAAVLAAAATASPSSADTAVAMRQEAGGFAWSPAQVRALIVEIRAARRHGLDPAAYGLAALGAELDLCEQLWNTPGSRQLDMLARTAALALANDYRRMDARGTAPIRPADLDAALGAGRIGPWLAAQAPTDRSAS